MDKKQIFIDTLEGTANIALATADGNVRFVSVGYDPAEPDILYFATFNQSAKAKAIADNPAVIFLPVPNRLDTEVTIRTFGNAAPSSASVERVAPLIGRHLPDFAAQLPQMLAGGVSLFEIKLKSAEVNLDMDPPELITF